MFGGLQSARRLAWYDHTLPQGLLERPMPCPLLIFLSAINGLQAFRKEDMPDDC